MKTLIIYLLSATCAVTGVLKAQSKPAKTGSYNLVFDTANYTTKTATVAGGTIAYRAYENIVYVSKPVDTKYQRINIYIPEAYFKTESLQGYTAATAPIFFPNNVGGYMPAEPATAEGNRGGRGGMPPGAPVGATGGNRPGGAGQPPAPSGGMGGRQNTILTALSKGYVVAAPGARGRTTKDSATGKFTGKAPACIVDLKAAVRYLRYNDKQMPGNAEKIVSNGTSAGGALSALLGASGNSKDYEPYLKAIGAADARDDVFAVSAYCPITNLDHADAAYEWQFYGVNDYQKLQITQSTDFRLERKTVAGALTSDEVAVSAKLKALFPAYVNSLKLKGADGKLLTLDAGGNGSFKNYVLSYVQASAQRALDGGTDVSTLDYLTVANGKVTGVDFDKYVHALQRMKTPPAFDGLNLSTGENDLFGSDTVAAKHFTAFAMSNTTVPATVADAHIVKMMNPINYIGTTTAQTAQHWRIRHGTADKDGSLATPVILATKLQNSGKDVNLALPWNVPHSGDYDLEELFTWIKEVCK